MAKFPFLRKLMLTTALAAGLTAAAFADDAAPKTKDGFTLDKDQIYHVLLGSSPTTLDPSQMVYTTDFLLARDLFETLVRQSPVDGKPIPAAAQSWTVSDDGLVYTFKLQPKGSWSDGKPVTAQDFVYSWRRLADPKTAAPYASYLEQMNVLNAADVYKGTKPVDALGVKALDDYTFQVTLSQPTPWFLDTLLLPVTAPLRQDVIEKYGDQWTQLDHFVTNGPFKMTNYSARDNIKLAKRPEHWDAANIIMEGAYFDLVESTDPNRDYFAYLSGLTDTSNIPATFRKKVAEKRPEELLEFVRDSVAYTRINNKRVPDPEVRKALVLLWDSKFLLDKVIPIGVPTGLLAPVGANGSEDFVQPEYLNQSMEERQAQALKILQAHGYSKENPLKLKYLVVGKANRIVVAIVERLNKWGDGLVKLDYQAVGDTQAAVLAVRQGDYDLSGSSWGLDFNHVTNMLQIFTCNDNNNEQFYCNPEFDALVKHAATVSDEKVRNQEYAQAVNILVKDAPVIPFYQVKSLILKSPRLQGYNVNNKYRYLRDYYHTTLRIKPE